MRPHIAGGELRRPDFQRLLVNSDVCLPPDPALGGAVFARVPLPFALDLDAGAVDQQVQRALRPAIGDVDLQDLLASAQGTEVWRGPIEADQPQEALDEASRLAQRQAEQHLHGQAGLDSSIAIEGLSAPLAGRRGLPAHLSVKPDRQRAASLEPLVVGGPVPGLVGRPCRSAHAVQLSRWITR